MMKWKWFIPLSCLVTFHAPNDGLITIETHQIAMVRSAEELAGQHLAAGTNSVIYLAGHKVGVTETREKVEELIENCGQGE
jgi:hypothetical protein